MLGQWGSIAFFINDSYSTCIKWAIIAIELEKEFCLTINPNPPGMLA